MLELLAVDTHGPLVALGDAHLMAAALHILARVLGGVHGCKTQNDKTPNDPEVSVTAEVFYFVPLQEKNTEILAFFFIHLMK